MIEIIKELNIEVSKPNVFQAVVAKQYDMNTRFIKATFVDYGEKITIPQSDTLMVTINALRNDGLSKGFDGVINDDGTVTVPLHSWMLELVGTVVCDISVIDTAEDDEKKLTTTSFTLIVEKAAWGGDGITNDPQGDVLIELLDRVESACETAEEALRKSTSANAVYDSMVEATLAAEAFADEWQNEISKTNARIDNLLVSKYEGGSPICEINTPDGFVTGSIKTNGAVAYCDISFSLAAAVQANGTWTYTDFILPPYLAPLTGERVFLNTADPDDENEITAFIDFTVANDNGWGRIQFGRAGGTGALMDVVETKTAYNLAALVCTELTDIRVGYDGTIYDTAEEAVTEQIKGAHEAISQHKQNAIPRITKLETKVDEHTEMMNDFDGDMARLTQDVEDLKKGGGGVIASTPSYAFAVVDKDGKVAFAIDEQGNVAFVGLDELKAHGQRIAALEQAAPQIQTGTVYPVLDDHYIANIEEARPVYYNAQEAGTLTFTMLSDIHASPAGGTVLKNVEASSVWAKIVNNDFIVLGGDLLNDSKNFDRNAALKVIDTVVEIAEKHADCPVYNIKGNHDTNELATGNENRLTDDEFYRHANARGEKYGMVTDPDHPYAGYYYVDFPRQKIRMVCLNTSEQYPDVDIFDPNVSDGNFRHIGVFSANQKAWIEDVALRVDEGWAVMMVSHIPPFTASNFNNRGTNNPALRALCEAFAAGTGSFAEQGAREFIAHFSGHAHIDAYNKVGGLNYVLVNCTFPYAKDSSGLYLDRTAEADKLSLNSFIIDRASHTVKCIKIGAKPDENYLGDWVDSFTWSAVAEMEG